MKFFGVFVDKAKKGWKGGRKGGRKGVPACDGLWDARLVHRCMEAGVRVDLWSLLHLLKSEIIWTVEGLTVPASLNMVIHLFTSKMLTWKSQEMGRRCSFAIIQITSLNYPRLVSDKSSNSLREWLQIVLFMDCICN